MKNLSDNLQNIIRDLYIFWSRLSKTTPKLYRRFKIHNLWIRDLRIQLISIPLILMYSSSRPRDTTLTIEILSSFSLDSTDRVRTGKWYITRDGTVLDRYSGSGLRPWYENLKDRRVWYSIYFEIRIFNRSNTIRQHLYLSFDSAYSVL